MFIIGYCPGIELAQLAAISSSVRVSQGETAILSCVGYGRPNAEITWMQNGQTVTNSSFLFISEQEFIQDGLLLKQSFLQICSARISDTGVYTCNVTNGVMSAAATTQFALNGQYECSIARNSFIVAT